MAVLKYKDPTTGNFISLPNNLIAPYTFEAAYPYNASTNPAATVQSITARLTGAGFEQKVADAIYDALGITPQVGKEHDLTEAIEAAVAEALENAFSTSESHTTAELALQTQISGAVAKAVEQALNTSGAQTPELVTAIESVVETFLADTNKFIAGSNVNIAHDTTNHTITISATDTTYSVMGASGSSHASGLVPDPGATAGTSKYLREDGTWETPPDNNTTYTFATGTTEGAFSVTPSGGSAQSVSIYGADFYQGSNTATSGANLPVSKRLVIATISSSTGSTLSLSGTLKAGRELHVIVKANGVNATINIPHNSTWINTNDMNTNKSCEVASGKIGEINIINGGTDSTPVYYVRYIGASA